MFSHYGRKYYPFLYSELPDKPPSKSIILKKTFKEIKQPDVKKEIPSFVPTAKPDTSIHATLFKPVPKLSLPEKILAKVPKKYVRTYSLSFVAALEATFNQDLFTEKVKSLRQKAKKIVWDGTGYCNGLAIMWLVTKALGTVNWFYDFKKLTMDDFIGELYSDEREIFLDVLDFWQGPFNYQCGLSQNGLDKLLDIPMQKKFPSDKTGNANLYDIYSMLYSVKQNDMVLISNNYSLSQLSCLSIMYGGVILTNHTLAVFREGKKYFVFHSGYEDGKEKEFDSLIFLADEVIKILKLDSFRSSFPIKFHVVSGNDLRLKLCPEEKTESKKSPVLKTRPAFK